MPNINAFVPESLFYAEKSQNTGRTLHEDSAIVSPHDHFKIICARGTLMKENASLCDLLDDTTSSSQLQKMLSLHDDTFTVPSRIGTLLIFPQIYASTGLILTVSVKIPGSTVEAFLDASFELSSRPVPATEENSQVTPSPKEILEEIFYYTDRIFSWDPCPDQRLLFRLIANFAGCRLSFAQVPFSPLQLQRSEKDRLTAFLLAVFLGMHKLIGTPCAATRKALQRDQEATTAKNTDALPTEVIGAPALSLEITQSLPLQGYLPPRHLETLENEQSLLIKRLLSLPAFSHFYATAEDGKMVFEANFPTSTFLGTLASRGTFKQIVFTLCPIALAK